MKRNNTCKCNRCVRSHHNRKNTRRGGSKFSRFSTYFPKRLRNFTTYQIAKHAIRENAGLAIGDLVRPLNRYLQYKVKDTNIMPPKVETFKPETYKWYNFMKPVHVLNPKTNVPTTVDTGKVFDLAFTNRKIGDILYQRDHASHASRASHAARAAHESHKSNRSRPSSSSQTAINSRNSRSRGP
jgi:hypothetical protein